MARLKFLERLLEPRVEEVPVLVLCLPGEAVLETEPLALRPHCSSALARVHGPLRDRGPSSRCRHCTIARQRLTQAPVANFRWVQSLQRGGDIPRRQCRLQHDGDVGGAPVRYPFRTERFGIYPPGEEMRAIDQERIR